MKFSKVVALLSCVSLLLFNTCSKENNQVTGSNESTQAKKAWTYLFYDDADVNNIYDPLNDFSTLVSSGNNVNYIVLREEINSTGEIYFIDNSHKQIGIDNLGRVNMGDENTLLNFLQYGKKYYPAERYILAFYDHGNGWLGTCNDDAYNDVLTMQKIQSAYKSVNGIDVTLFTAPCLMSAVESVYELRNLTNLYVGSANVSGFAYWFGVLPDLNTTLEDNPSIALYDIAQEIILSAAEHKNDFGVGGDMTLSAINPAATPELVAAINDMSNYYLSHLDELKSYLPKIQSKIHFYWTGYCDLISLVDNLLSVEHSQEAQGYLQNIKVNLQKCIVAESHGENQTPSCGLNIYLPYPFTNNCLSGYSANDNLDFLHDANWDNLLASLQRVIGKLSINATPHIINEGNGYLPPKKY